jgi:hypothetical protein
MTSLMSQAVHLHGKITRYQYLCSFNTCVHSILLFIQYLCSFNTCDACFERLLVLWTAVLFECWWRIMLGVITAVATCHKLYDRCEHGPETAGGLSQHHHTWSIAVLLGCLADAAAPLLLLRPAVTVQGVPASCQLTGSPSGLYLPVDALSPTKSQPLTTRQLAPAPSAVQPPNTGCFQFNPLQQT